MATTDVFPVLPGTPESGELRAAGRHQQGLIALYSVVVALYWMAQYVYAASLPSYVQSKTGSLASAGFVLSMYGLCQAIVRIPIGVFADRLGWWKPFVVSGLTLAAIGAWIIGTADTRNGLLLGRAVTGLAAGSWVPIVVAYSSLFPPNESIRASAYLIVLQATGRIVASAANGPLNKLGGFKLAFYVAVGIAVIALFLSAFIHEQRRPATRHSVKVIWQLFLRRDVMLPSVLATLTQTVTWGLSLTFILIAAKQLGGTDNTQGVLATLAVVMLAVGSGFINLLTRHLGPRRVILLSIGLLSLGCALMSWASSVHTLFASQISLGLGLGLSYASLMGLSIRRVHGSERSIAMGIHQTMYALGMFLGPALCGLLAQAYGIYHMCAIVALRMPDRGAHWELQLCPQIDEHFSRNFTPLGIERNVVAATTKTSAVEVKEES